MSKFTFKEKLEAIMRYLSGKESYKSIAKSLGTDHMAIRKWVKLYEHHGEKSLTKRYTPYNKTFKLNVLNYMIEHGTSLQDTAAIFNIPSPSTITVWKQLLKTKGYGALQSTKKGRPTMKKESKKIINSGSVEALEARIKELEMENDYLKKLNALVQSKEKSPNKTKR